MFKYWKASNTDESLLDETPAVLVSITKPIKFIKMLNQNLLQDLAEGQPIFYNQSGNLTSWDSVCSLNLTLTDELCETEVLPLSKMGYKFKKDFIKLFNLINS